MRLFPLFLALLSQVSGQECLRPVEMHGSLSVQGTQVVNEEQENVSLAGNSFFWSNNAWGGELFYTRAMVEYLAEDWNASIVRAAMGVQENGAYLDDPVSNRNRVETLVDAAIDEGLYVIIDWHSHHAEDNQSDAISFFREMAQRYGDYPNVIYEVYNEPLAVSWSNVIKPYAEAVIEVIREEDPDNLIIVGTPNWSQDVEDASVDPIAGTNIAYTIHFYAATHGNYYRNKARTAMDNGIALFCTEWGTVEASGDGAVDQASTNEWMDFFEEHSISHVNWAVNNKEEGSSIFQPNTSPFGSWSDSDLTASGVFVKSIISQWNTDCEAGLGETPEPEEPGAEGWVSHFVESVSSSGQITVEYQEIESWGTGFNGSITLTNNGAPIDGYTLSFSSAWTPVDFWNDVVWSEAGGVYSLDLRNHEWLGQLATGQSQTIGFTANGSLSDATGLLLNDEPLEEESLATGLSFEEWAASHEVAGVDGDDDRDGFENMLEFLMGTDPSDSTSVPSLESEVVSGVSADTEGSFLSVKFLVNSEALGVEYRFLVSDNLTDWNASINEMGMELVQAVESENGMLEVQWLTTQSMETSAGSLFTCIEAQESR